jgi:hypothetical protein
MSYLNNVRLVFSGQFQADVSTVNNDVRHFDNQTFQESYQDFQNDGDWNGWFNPTGSGAFRLIDCRVRAVHYADGSSADTPAQDPLVGMAVGGADDRTSGKIVDIDPQWQLASELWGLKVRLSDAAGATVLLGDYAAYPFRDLIFSRAIGLGGDRAASAYFQSVLTGVAWSDKPPASKFLDQLRKATQDGKLSIRLTTFAYQDDHTKSGFTFGTVSGVIGPYLDGEPDSFVLGRRFAPGFGASSWNGINFFTGLLAGRRLFLDLSNALPLDAKYRILDIGELTVGTLLNSTVPEGAPVGPGAFQAIGKLPYRDPDWLLKSGGIAAFTLTDAQLGNQPPNAGNPLAIVAQKTDADVPLVAIRETVNGLYVGAEPFVLRIDAGGAANVAFYAASYGMPLSFGQVQLAQTGEMPNLGGGPTDLDPPVPIPVAGIPQGALAFPPAVATDGNGVGGATIATSAPNNPRGYLDGQLYNVNFQLAGQTRQAFGPFETIAIHLRDAYPVPAVPTWANDIAPIFIQYGNLYPIMSRRLVNLNDPVSVYEHRKLLSLSFSRDIGDPNYMPVTRDLSENKRLTIVKWLDALDSGADPAFHALLKDRVADERPALTSEPTPAPAAPVLPDGGKTTFAQGLARSRRARRPE